MYLLCWSAKGGVGTSVVAAAVALATARHAPTTLIDLGGDAPGVLGCARPTGPGVGDWWSTPHAPADALLTLAEPVAPNLQLVHTGTLPRLVTELHAERLALAAAADTTTNVVIDAGHGVPHEVLHRCAHSSLLVARPCYLGIQRMMPHARLATGVVLVSEPGRALGSADVARTLGTPVVAEVPWDPAVSRSVDSGLLRAQLPMSLRRPLGRLGYTGGVGG
jgi:MinD-like ATPase involved in chromosome partitioning or flagellar assembly